VDVLDPVSGLRSQVSGLTNTPAQPGQDRSPAHPAAVPDAASVALSAPLPCRSPPGQGSVVEWQTCSAGPLRGQHQRPPLRDARRPGPSGSDCAFALRGPPWRGCVSDGDHIGLGSGEHHGQHGTHLPSSQARCLENLEAGPKSDHRSGCHIAPRLWQRRRTAKVLQRRRDPTHRRRRRPLGPRRQAPQIRGSKRRSRRNSRLPRRPGRLGSTGPREGRSSNPPVGPGRSDAGWAHPPPPVSLSS
jgi:hypothetical protein